MRFLLVAVWKGAEDTELARKWCGVLARQRQKADEVAGLTQAHAEK